MQFILRVQFGGNCVRRFFAGYMACANELAVGGAVQRTKTIPFCLTKTAELENNAMMGASCAVGPFSAVSPSLDAALTVPKSHGYLRLGTVSAASQLADTAENGPNSARGFHHGIVLKFRSFSSDRKVHDEAHPCAVEYSLRFVVSPSSPGGGDAAGLSFPGGGTA